MDLFRARNSRSEAKKAPKSRALRIEGLEERQLLSATTCDEQAFSSSDAVEARAANSLANNSNGPSLNELIANSIDLGYISNRLWLDESLSDGNEVVYYAFSLDGEFDDENCIALLVDQEPDFDLDLVVYNSFGDPIASSAGTSGDEVIYIENWENGDYFAEVRNKVPGGRGGWYCFVIDAPQTYEERGPLISVEVVEPKVEVTIGSLSNSSQYILQYGTDISFNEFSQKTFSSAGTYELSNLPLNETVYFRVKATWPQYDDSEWTRTSAFITNPDAFEPNYSKEKAYDLGTVIETVNLNLNLSSCFDEDWLCFTTLANGCEDNYVRLTYDPIANSDVCCELYRLWEFDDGDRYYSFEKGTEPVSGSESFDFNNLPAGTYYLLVHNNAPSFGSQGGFYSLEISPPTPVGENDLEPPVVDCWSVGDPKGESMVDVDIAPVENAQGYVLQYGTDPSFESCSTVFYYDAYDSETGTGFHTLKDLSPWTNYYLRVKAVAPGRADSPWTSAVWSAPSLYDPNDQFEPNDALSTSYDLGTIIGTSTISSSVTSRSDRDYFKFTLPINGDSNSSVTLSADTFDLVSINFRIRNSQGVWFNSSFASGGKKVSLKDMPAGDYYIEIYHQWTYDPVLYSLTVATPSTSAIRRPILAISSQNAASISLNIGAVSGASEYAVQYSVNPNFQNATSVSYSSAGNKTIANLSPSTTYYFRVQAKSSAGASGWSTITATTADQFEPNNARASAYDLGTLIGESSYNANLHSGSDEDYYKFVLTETGKWDSRVELEHNRDNYYYDYYGCFDFDLALYDESGALVGKSTDRPGIEKISLNGLGPGTYYLRVYNYEDSKLGDNYRLTIRAPEPDPKLANPVVTSSVTKTAVVLKITGVENATRYVVQYSTDQTFATFTEKGYPTAGSKTVSGLTSGTSYYFRLKATADGYDDSDWVSFVATTTKDTLGAPTLAKSATATASITVTIGAVENAANYVLEYSKSSNFASATTKTYASAGSKSITGLTASTTYYFRVKATAERFNDSAWTSISARTQDETGEQLPVPTITALSGTKTALVVKFDAVDGAAKYVLEYATDASFSDAVAKTYSTAGSKTITGLTTGTWYYVRLKATATGRPASDYTPVRKIYTGGSYAMPSFTFSAVKTAVVLNIKPGKIDATQGAPDKYVVEYSENPDFSNAKTKTVSQTYNEDGSLKDCKPTISGLTFGTSYYFRVKATGSLGNDSAWNANNGKTIAAGQLAVPTFFTSKVGSDFINVRCYNSASASGYEVMCSTSSDFSEVQYAQTSASSGVVSITGLNPETKYYYKVRALGDNVSRVDSSWSVIVGSATTKEAAPLPALDAPTATTSATKTAIVVKIVAVENATNYVLEYGTDPTFETFSTKTYATVGAKTLSGLASGKTYYLRLTATASGYSDSIWTPFSVRTIGPVAAPVVTCSTTKSAVVLNIGSVEDAESYVVEYGTSATFDGVSTRTYPTSGVKTISGLTSGTTYYFRVKAVSEQYGDSEWTAISTATKTGAKSSNSNSAFENYFDDELEEFWDVLAESLEK